MVSSGLKHHFKTTTGNLCSLPCGAWPHSLLWLFFGSCLVFLAFATSLHVMRVLSGQDCVDTFCAATVSSESDLLGQS